MTILLEVDNLGFLDHGPFSFTVEAGECVGIHGASGIGKSQMFRALADLIPSTGTITCDGIRCEALAAPQWRRKVTMAPAEPVWWGEKVCDHFRDQRFCEKAKDNLVQLGLDPELQNWQVSRLSTGERQRLGLLRALQNSPQVLLLDEPTSALDKTNTQRTETFLSRYREHEHAGLMWVSHDPDQLLRISSRIMIMERDRLQQIDREEFRKKFCL